ncbi:MAG: hypothetical protein GJ680_05970 [Alteromonadaceae bacterium]|nr:hypothetical protein [Alteromonadaceae bacterium]
MSHSIIYSHNILQISFSGHVTNDELVLLDKALFDEWQHDDCEGHLYDYTALESISFTEQDVKQVAMLDRNESLVNGHLKVAIVSVEEYIAKYSRIYVEEMQTSDWDVRLFDNLEDAKKFLGLS